MKPDVIHPAGSDDRAGPAETRRWNVAVAPAKGESRIAFRSDDKSRARKFAAGENPGIGGRVTLIEDRGFGKALGEETICVVVTVNIIPVGYGRELEAEARVYLEEGEDKPTVEWLAARDTRGRIQPQEVVDRLFFSGWEEDAIKEAGLVVPAETAVAS